jgi:hypothetical protein
MEVSGSIIPEDTGKRRKLYNRHSFAKAIILVYRPAFSILRARIEHRHINEVQL